MLPPRAYTFIGLNGLRILSIIALLLVFSSSIVIMVHDIQAVNRFVAAGKASGGSDSTTTDDGSSGDTDYISGSTVPNQPAGAFWATLNRLLIIFQTIVLILSEIGWPSAFFSRYFPVLGDDFGLGALGIIQGLIGAAVLSHHVDDFALVSSFFLFAIACLNMLAGLIWRQSAKSKRSITSWREHAKSALPTHVAGVDVRPMMPSAPPAFMSNIFSGHKNDDNSNNNEKPPNRAGLGFGRQAEKAAALKGYFISRPIESLPRYAAKTTATGSTQYSSSPTVI